MKTCKVFRIESMDNKDYINLVAISIIMTDICYAAHACSSHFSISVVNFLKAKSNVFFFLLQKVLQRVRTWQISLDDHNTIFMGAFKFLNLNTFKKHKRTLNTWTSPDGQHQNQIDYILCRQRWRSSIQSAKTRPGADCGSDHELLIAKIRLKWTKVGKTTRPLRYDLNQNPYDYTVEV